MEVGFMRVIAHDDLKILVSLVRDIDNWDLDDFKKLLDRFGSEYFIEGGAFVKTTENKEMAEIRKNVGG